MGRRSTREWWARKRKKAVRTAESGMASRGNAVLMSSLPEVVTEVDPLVMAVDTMLNANRPRVRWVKKAGSCSRRMIVTRR